jgi:hypothetical protein
MPDISVHRINVDSEGMHELIWCSVVNGLYAAWLGFWFLARTRNFFFFFFKMSQLAFGPTKPTILWVCRGYSSWVVKLKTAYTYLVLRLGMSSTTHLLLLYVFMAWTDKFTVSSSEDNLQKYIDKFNKL